MLSFNVEKSPFRLDEELKRDKKTVIFLYL